MTVRSLGLSLALALLWCAPALAADFGVARHAPIYGPRIAGDSVVWAVGSADGGYRLRRQVGTGRPQSIRLMRNARPDSVLEPKLAASASAIFVQLPRVFRPSGRAGFEAPPEDLGTGAVSGARLGPACVDSLQCDQRTVDVDGTVVVHATGASGSRTVEARDLAAPTVAPFRIQGVTGAARVAGRFVAVVSNSGRIEVYDRLARRLEYQVTPTGAVSSLDLQGDGTIAAALSTQGRESMWWASTAAPSLHRVPVPARRTYQVKLVNGTIAYEASGPGNGAADYLLGATGLTGANRLLVRSVNGYPGDERFDFDGTSLAWLARDCRQLRLRTGRLSDLTAEPRLKRRKRCRLSFRSTRRRVARGGSFTVRLRCVTFSRNCVLSKLRLRAKLGGRGRTVTVATLKPSAALRQTVRVRLTRRARRYLRRNHVLRASARGVVADTPGAELQAGTLRLIQRR